MHWCPKCKTLFRYIRDFERNDCFLCKWRKSGQWGIPWGGNHSKEAEESINNTPRGTGRCDPDNVCVSVSNS